MVPIKSRGAGFQGSSNVTKPKWTPGAVLQQMKTQEAQMIFRT